MLETIVGGSLLMFVGFVGGIKSYDRVIRKNLKRQDPHTEAIVRCFLNETFDR